MGRLRSVLEASGRVLEASWRCLGGVLGRLGGILDVSWGKYRKKAKEDLLLKGFVRVKWMQKSLKFRFKINLLFLAFLNVFFVILHVFEKQLVRTCSRRILAKQWLGAQKLSFAED